MIRKFWERRRIQIIKIFETPENVRAGIFNLMAIVGFFVSVIVLISSIFNDAGLMNLLAMLVSAVLSISLFIYTNKTGKYKVGYIITIFVLFVILFPFMFFTAGGMHSGMPMFFSFAVVFTIFMLENKTGLVISAFELIEYLICCFLSMKYPSLVIFFETEEAVYKDIILGVVSCTIALAVTVYLQAVLYRKQHIKTQEALEDAKLQSNAKDIFLANMSHELRTPINILLGMSEMIERTANDEQVISYNHNIQIFANQLQDMVKDLLDITKIKTRQININKSPYNIEALARELELTGKELARRKDLAFSFVRNYDKEYSIVGDQERIKQVVTNLINNAVKYTKTGYIKVYFNVTKNEDMCNLEFIVEDSGIGIPKEETKEIFEMFHRIDNEYRKKIEGTGLGLAITKQLLDCMDGEITLESEVGKGSKFLVNINQEISKTEVELTKSSEELHFIAPDARILIVDDNKDNLQIMKLILDRTMMKIDTALSGEEGIILAQSKHYDSIILDYMMPGMDGIATLEKMKEVGVQSTFISLTADAVLGTAEKIIAAGFNEYVTKPVKWHNFEKMLMKYIPSDKIIFESEADNSADISEVVASLSKIVPENRVDITMALKRVGGNVSTYGRILGLFCDHYEVNSAEGRKLFDNEEYEALTYVVHSLKSQALGIGAVELHKSAMTLEAHLKENDIEYAKSSFPLLMLMWERAAFDAKVLADEIVKNSSEKKSVMDGEDSLVEKAKEALKQSVWLEAREALEVLSKKYSDNSSYSLALEKTDNLEFEKALEILEQ